MFPGLSKSHYQKLIKALYKRLESPLRPNSVMKVYYALSPATEVFTINPIWAYLNGACPTRETREDEEWYEWMSIDELYGKVGSLYESKLQFGEEFLESWAKGSGIEFGLFKGPYSDAITVDSLCLRSCPMLVLAHVEEQIEWGNDPEFYRTQTEILNRDPCPFHYDKQELHVPVPLRDIKMGPREVIGLLSEADARAALNPVLFDAGVREYFDFNSW